MTWYILFIMQVFWNYVVYWRSIEVCVLYSEGAIVEMEVSYLSYLRSLRFVDGKVTVQGDILNGEITFGHHRSISSLSGWTIWRKSGGCAQVDEILMVKRVRMVGFANNWRAYYNVSWWHRRFGGTSYISQ